jgi:hypothetical protein
MCMRFERCTFLDSLSYLHLSLRKLPEAFVLTSSKSWYPQYFNTEKYLDYIGPIPDTSCYGASEIIDSERTEIFEWYEGQKDEVFDNRHAGIGRKYTLSEYPHLGVDGYCPATKKVQDFLECFLHAHTYLPFRDVTTMGEDKLAEKCESTLARLQHITRAGYQAELQWKCDFEDGILDRHPELQTHSIVEHSPLNTRDTMYGGRTEAVRLHYKIREGETI